MESCKDMAQHRKRLNEESFMIEKGEEPRSSAVKMKIRAKKQTTKEKNGGISRKTKDLRRDVAALLKQKFVKNVVQDLTSGGLLGVWGKWVKHAKYIYNIQDFNPEQVLRSKAYDDLCGTAGLCCRRWAAVLRQLQNSQGSVLSEWQKTVWA